MHILFCRVIITKTVQSFFLYFLIVKVSINYPKIRDILADYLVLASFFLCFSFNNIALAKYYYLLGQASTYFMIAALIIRFPKIQKKAYIFCGIFISYCLITPFILCMGKWGICTVRPLTGVFNTIFIMLTVLSVSQRVKESKTFLALIGSVMMLSALAIILLSIPDIYAITKGNIRTSPFEAEYLKFGGGTTYDAPRIRGFTPEPSYFGMVIAVIYPIALFKLMRTPRLFYTSVVLGLLACLIFSFSRTGIITCLILTFLMTLNSPRYKKIFFSILLGCFLLVYFIPGWLYLFYVRFGIDFYILGLVEKSSFTRFGLMYAAISMWTSDWKTILFGVGLGQSGYLLDSFFPQWFWRSPEAEHWADKAGVGGIPSFALLPKMICEIGLVGVLLLLSKIAITFASIRRSWRDSSDFRMYAWSFFGFIVASFGVDGYFYLSAWMVFGVLIGLIANSNLTVRPPNIMAR